jgi:hypothetical protein
MEDALLKEDAVLLWNSVRENHRLLCEIGVVPTRVKKMIEAIEALGGAAKICGAGSVTGENAGVVWVVGNAIEAYKKAIAEYQADWMGNTLLCPKGAQICLA